MKMEQKPKIFALNNFIASDTGRLSSLSPLSKRDLSLGGNKPKKVYKPNLNVIRNKNKGKIAINNKVEQLQNNKRKSILTRTNKQRFIQSASVFSDGAGELKRPKIHSDRYLSNGERDQTAVYMPKVIKWEVNMQEEKAVINDLLADDDDDSSSENECEYSPVVLPLKDNKDGFVKAFKIKKENPDLVEIKEEIPKPILNSHRINGRILNCDIPWSFQNNKMYSEDRPCISLLRMPDSLPGKGFEEDSSKVTDFDLGQMTEGKIGRVLIRRSGKVEIHIGNMKYVLDTVEANPFKEDLMSVSLDPSSSFGPDMINLGNIDEKYVLSPCWKKLFSLRAHT